MCLGSECSLMAMSPQRMRSGIGHPRIPITITSRKSGFRSSCVSWSGWRDLCGGGVIMLPSFVADFSDPDMRRMIEATQIFVIGTAEEGVRAFRLAWDAIGSEFASAIRNMKCSTAVPTGSSMRMSIANMIGRRPRGWWTMRCS